MAIDLKRYTVHPFVNKALALLRVRSAIGGLEIGDSVLRFTRLDGNEWRLNSLRLPPGIVEGGLVKQYPEFVDALRTLKEQAQGPRDKRKLLNAVVSLSSINIYSQVFSLPVIVGENLEKAIQLNIQMISPDDVSKTYSGWQLVGEDQKSVKLEILSAFINRSVVDDIKRALKEAGIVAYSLESRALSLARTIRTLGAGFDQNQSYVVVNLDTNGIEFLILRRGQLYFEYFNPWRDFETEGHQIEQAVFEGLIIRNLHQVLNFYNAHWSEQVGEILLSASALKENVATVIKNNFQLPVRDVALTAEQAIGPDWFVALGSGLRGQISRRDDRDLSLLGTTAQDEFRHHQVMDFLRFWRVAVPAAFAVLVATFVGMQVFLTRVEGELVQQVAQSVVDESGNAEIAELKRRVALFNGIVSSVQHLESTSRSSDSVISSVAGLFGGNGVGISRMDYSGPLQPVKITAFAPSDEDVLRLRTALNAATDIVKSVDIPLTGIIHGPQGVSFTVNIELAEVKAE